MSIRRLATLLWVAGSIGAVQASPPNAADIRLKQIMQQARPQSASVAQHALMKKRTELLQQGEAALARVDVDAALKAFDQAAGILHAADTEMGLVRAYMQGGEYRRALAFVAHTAQAHREVAGAAALYAWLLYSGGQSVNAKQILGDAASLFPRDTLLAEARRQLDSRAPIATGALLKLPARMAPFGPMAGSPSASRVASTGVLIDSGKRALIPLAAVGKATTVWVRDGLGRSSRATVERRVAASDLALLQLDSPITGGPDLAMAAGDPFPGSVAFAVEYVATASAMPSWPLLSSGFIGSASADGARRQLGIDLPSGPRGGPVFDFAGRLIGIALASSDGNDRLVPVSQLRQLIGAPLGKSATALLNQRMPVDQIYEAALRTTIQVITAR